MKKLLLFFLVLPLLFASCADGTRAADILGYESAGGELSLSFRADGQDFSATLSLGEERRLTFASPASVAGVSYSLSGDAITASFGDGGEVRGEFPLPRAIFDCFSLSERLAGGELEFLSEEGKVFVFESDDVRYEIHASGEIPTRIVRRADGEILTVDIGGMAPDGA